MRRPLALGCLLFIVAVFLYVCLFPPAQVETDMAEGKTVYLAGKVYRKEIRSNQFGEDNYIIYLNHIVISDESKSLFENEKTIQGVLCYMENEDEIPLGSTVAVRGNVQEFMQSTNPGEFDSRQYYQILKLDFKLKNTELVTISANDNKLYELLYCIKEKCSMVLECYYDETDAGIMKTILLGDKNSLSETIEEQYKRNGIIHIMAISGLHISMLGMGLYKILKKLKLPLGAAGVTTVLFIWCYGILAGMSASACRAIIMFGFKIAADLLGRTYDLLTALAVSAVLLLLEQPLYIRHCGFLLSFGAVLGIGVVLPVLEKDFKKKSGRTGKKIRERIVSGLFPGIAVFLVSFPIQIYYYYQYPIYSLLLNLFIIPLMTVVMVSGLAVLFCGVLPSSVLVHMAGKLLAFSGHIILAIYSIACGGTEKLPGAVAITGQPKVWQMVVYYGTLLFFLFWRERQEKLKRYFLVVRLAVLAAGFCLLLARFQRGFEITFLNVGQGDCIYVRSEGKKAYLFDGGSTDRSQVGTYQITPFLKSQGVGCLEAVFVSHGDKDHYSGIEELLEDTESDRIHIKRLVLPVTEKTDAETNCREEVTITDNEMDGMERLKELARAQGIEIVYIKKGDKIKDGMLQIECFHPSLEQATLTEDRNEQSEVFYITYGNFSTLLTGDVTGEAERNVKEQLEQKTNGRPVTVLKVAHHGSMYSTDADFLAAASPLISIISCGENNSYGHPHKELLERLEECKTQIYKTMESGAITIWTDGERVEVTEYNSLDMRVHTY